MVEEKAESIKAQEDLKDHIEKKNKKSIIGSSMKIKVGAT